MIFSPLEENSEINHSEMWGGRVFLLVFSFSFFLFFSPLFSFSPADEILFKVWKGAMVRQLPSATKQSSDGWGLGEGCSGEEGG